MSDSPHNAPLARWATLNREVQVMKDSLNRFTLIGALDRNTNHIASMQEEIDQKTREALMVYWLDVEQGDLPRGIA